MANNNFFIINHPYALEIQYFIYYGTMVTQCVTNAINFHSLCTFYKIKK